MTQAAINPVVIEKRGSAEESRLWLPPRRMARYQWAKVGGAVVVAGIFLGWLLIQWSNPFIRGLTAVLLVVTGWVTIRSVMVDEARRRGRQLQVAQGCLTILTPGKTRVVRLADVAHARWREEDGDVTGMWLYDSGDRLLAHLDGCFLADQAEAREFLGWVRKLSGQGFPVEWRAADSDGGRR